MYKVLIPQDIQEEGKQYLREKGYEIQIGSGFDRDTLKKEISDADAVIARTAAYPADDCSRNKAQGYCTLWSGL